MIYRWAEIKLYPNGALVGYDLSGVEAACSSATVSEGLANHDLIWRDHTKEGLGDVYFSLDDFPHLPPAHARWYVLREQAEHLFQDLAFPGEGETYLVTMLHKTEGSPLCFVGVLIGRGERFATIGASEPPAWWGLLWPRPVYPSAYEHLLAV